MSSKQSDFLWINFIADVISDIFKDLIPSTSSTVAFIVGWNTVVVKALPTIAQTLVFSDMFFNVWIVCYLFFSTARFVRKHQD